MRSCTGRGVATAVAAATTVPAPATATTAAKPRSRLQFTLHQTRRGLGVAVEPFTVNMKEEKRLSTLKNAIYFQSSSGTVSTRTSCLQVSTCCQHCFSPGG